LIPGFESLTPAIVVFVIGVIAVTGFIYGLLGLGLPLIATPLFVLLMPMRDAMVLILLPCLAAILVSILTVPDLRGALRRFWFMPIMAVIGSVIGAQLFVRAPHLPYALLLAAVMLAWAWLDWHGRSESKRMQAAPVAWGAVFGLLAGLTETTTNVAAPPLLVYYVGLGLSPAAMIQGMNLSFAPGKTIQFVTLATLGGVPLVQWLVTLPLVAITVCTQLVGVRVRDRVPAATYRRWLRWCVIIMAVVIAAQVLWQRVLTVH
jgi:uncharacterized protein